MSGQKQPTEIVERAHITENGAYFAIENLKKAELRAIADYTEVELPVHGEKGIAASSPLSEIRSGMFH